MGFQDLRLDEILEGVSVDKKIETCEGEDGTLASFTGREDQKADRGAWEEAPSETGRKRAESEVSASHSRRAFQGGRVTWCWEVHGIECGVAYSVLEKTTFTGEVWRNPGLRQQRKKEIRITKESLFPRGFNVRRQLWGSW